MDRKWFLSEEDDEQLCTLQLVHLCCHWITTIFTQGTVAWEDIGDMWESRVHRSEVYGRRKPYNHKTDHSIKADQSFYVRLLEVPLYFMDRVHLFYLLSSIDTN